MSCQRPSNMFFKNIHVLQELYLFFVAILVRICAFVDITYVILHNSSFFNILLIDLIYLQLSKDF